MKYENTEILMYRTEDGRTKIDVRLVDGTLWLTQQQMVDLFQSSKANISEHLKNVFSDGELPEYSVVRNFRTTAADGKNYNTKHYSLDAILAVGYRVKSPRGTQFRQWATGVLHEYLQKGFALNDDLLKNAGGGLYWKELLERIRDIRSSEKVFYRQLLDLFATSVDYDPKSEECRHFFKIIQNKLHYAVNMQTSAEIIFTRADAEKPFMGMQTFRGETPHKDDALVAKNYLNEKELAVLNRLVSAFFDLAELHALNRDPLYMSDWLPQVDDFAERYGKGVLQNAGTVSRQAAIEKATEEYKKYRKRIAELPSPAERDYLESIKQAQKKLKGKTESD